jgi:hypothetical protein
MYPIGSSAVLWWKLTEITETPCENFARKNFVVCTRKFFFHVRCMEVVKEIPCAEPLDHFSAQVNMKFLST